MKEFILEKLICPSCIPIENPLRLKNTLREGDDIVSGILRCRSCGKEYPIKDGVAVVLKDNSLTESDMKFRYETRRMLSFYLWAHYSDLWGDEGNDIYYILKSLIQDTKGPFLDTGCAVGRLTMEMSDRAETSIGIDISFTFIKKARELMLNGGQEAEIPIEGELMERHYFKIKPEWKTDKVEFIVADAERIPFKEGSFSCASSMNLIDRLKHPILHLKELSRILNPVNGELLISDPFSWDPDIAEKDEWLGGKHSGRFSGSSEENLKAIIMGKGGLLSPPFSLKSEGNAWWKIRNHQRHYELINSYYLLAIR